MSEIAERLRRWQPTEDDNGLAVVRDLIEATRGGKNSLWRLDVANVPVLVLAAFSCDENGLLTYNGELTLSMMIDGRFEIADTGLSRLEDLADLTGQHDSSQRLFTLLDAITDHLNLILARVLQFSRHHDHERGDPPARMSQPLSSQAHDQVPTTTDTAAQIRRDIAFGNAPTSLLPRIPPAPGFGHNAEELITARERALGRSRGSFWPEVEELNHGWTKAGCPTIGVVSITPGTGGEHNTEFVLSNGLQLLVSQTGIGLSDTRGRHLYFLDAINPEAGHDHLHLTLRPDA
ncbi:hypothetical protein [Nocardia sp. NPDC047648]|uniref:hypothetical protein n=1 Tax=Nocardia sp. NPDC047648 TaxID=3155625 RepID=UPI0033EF8D12